MHTSAHQVFVAMYQALDAAYDASKSKKVFAFCADANPYIWKGKTSADPAVFNTFSKQYESRFKNKETDPSNTLAFVRSYLAEQNSEYAWEEGDLVKEFDSVVAPELWVEAITSSDS